MAEASVVNPLVGIEWSEVTGFSNWASSDVEVAAASEAEEVVVAVAVVEALLPLNNCLSKAFCCCWSSPLFASEAAGP